MSTQNLNINFSISGNALNSFTAVNNTVESLNANITGSLKIFNSFGGMMVAFQGMTQTAENFKQAINDMYAPGVALNSSLADLSAITGQTGEGLKQIEIYARESAKTFGVDAAQSVESYKLLLSQLSPNLADKPAALKAMGDAVSTLSKTMGGDSTAAANVLTTAMNQYGVSLEDPMAATEEMTRMMNVMAAAGKEGSAELPQIAAALAGCGMAAKAANISFEETNAAIQVLDKAGKKGAEGGVALRNAITIMGQGRFMPKDTQEALAAAGIDVERLGDTSLSLTDRLTMLRPVLADSALLSKMFGMENSNAARALIQGIPQIQQYQAAITDTNTAQDQAAVIMESYAERQKRVQAQFDDLKISVFNATGDMGIWMQVVAGSLVPISQLMPLLMGVGKAMAWTRTSIIAANTSIKTFVLQCRAGGLASTRFARVSRVAFRNFSRSARVAFRAVSIAFKAIPIIGWVAIIVGALSAVFAYFWKTSAKFRGAIKGLWAYVKTIFLGQWELAKNVFGAIGDLIKAALTFDGKGIRTAIGNFASAYTDLGKSAASAFSKAYNDELESSKKETISNEDILGNVATSDTVVPTTTVVPSPSGAGKRIASSTSGKIRNINITIDKLVGEMTISTTNLKESKEKIREMISEALMGGVNDASYAV